jgi:hypothetical protein
MGLGMTSDGIQAAITAGIDYLERVQGANGELPVFAAFSPDMTDRRHLDPCFFGTVAIASTLIDCPEAADLSRRACDFIVNDRKPGKLWSYYKTGHRIVYPMPDVDDTGLALIALAGNGRKIPRNRRILLANRDRKGMFYTWIYPWRSPIRLALLTATWRSISWFFRYRAFFANSLCEAHDVDGGINANILAALGAFEGDQRVIDFLLNIVRQEREASCDKYYDDPVLIRYFFSRALAGRCPEAGELLVARAHVDADASAFHIALTILTLALWKASIPDDLVRRLVAQQGADGAWSIASFYCAGRPRRGYCDFAPAIPDIFRCGSEAMTTALCISALNAVRAGEYPG